jgi:hypothetical protein
LADSQAACIQINSLLGELITHQQRQPFDKPGMKFGHPTIDIVRTGVADERSHSKPGM